MWPSVRPPSTGRHATRDEVVFQQGGDGQGDVFGAAGAARRVPAMARRRSSLEVFGQQDGTGEDGVDAHFGSELDGEHPHERGDRAFRGEVCV